MRHEKAEESKPRAATVEKNAWRRCTPTGSSGRRNRRSVLIDWSPKASRPALLYSLPPHSLPPRINVYKNRKISAGRTDHAWLFLSTQWSAIPLPPLVPLSSVPSLPLNDRLIERNVCTSFHFKQLSNSTYVVCINKLLMLNISKWL